MQISVVILDVHDVDRAIAFYTKQLGFEKTMDAPMGEGGRWVTVAPAGGSTAFGLMKNDDRSPEERFSSVILEVDDVFAASEQLKKRGVEFVEAPRTEPWGGWATFKDSEGNRHGLHSPAFVESARG